MPKISVIVPVFNKEEYIDECIKSILDQSFSDIEIILVNDGSTDRSGEKCEHFKTIDSRVLVINQENQGVSAARNKGLSLAKGEFIGFVDSDDTIDKDMFEVLYTNTQNFDAEVSICTINLNGQNRKSIFFDTPKKMNREEAISGLFNGSLNWSANNKLYKSSMARSVLFEGSINEDLFFCFRVFMNTSIVVFEDVPKYNYNQRGNSVSLSQFGSKYMQIVKYAEKILTTTTEKLPSLVDEAKVLHIVANISILNLILLSNKSNYKKELELVSNNLKGHHHFIMTNKRMKSKHIVAYTIFRLNANIYAFFMKLYCSLAGSSVLERV